MVATPRIIPKSNGLKVIRPRWIPWHSAWLGLLLSLAGTFGAGAATNLIAVVPWANYLVLLVTILCIPGFMLSLAALFLEKDGKLIAVVGMLLGLWGSSSIATVILFMTRS